MKRKRGEAMTDRAKEKEKGEENRSLDIEIERIHNKSSLENSQDQDWADHVAFFTDVEGNMDYFRSLVRNSRILKYVDEEETRLDFIHVFLFPLFSFSFFIFFLKRLILLFRMEPFLFLVVMFVTKELVQFGLYSN